MPRGNPYAYGRSKMRPQADRDLNVGREVEDEYVQRARDFDATGAARTAGSAIFDEVQEGLDRNVRTLRGAQVGRGRINSGFDFEDEDELVGDTYKNLARTLAQNAITTTGMNLRNMEGLGGYGERTTGRGLDIVASERDADIDEEEMRRRDEERRRSGLFGAIGRIGGTVLGPAGSIVGERIGRLFD